MINSKNSIFSNLIWRYAERSGAQIVSLVVSVILARLLEPEVYGTLTLIEVFITFLNVFIDSGLGSALIQKKDADETDFSTVFYVNIVFCITLYVILFVGAPLIANFYNNPNMVAYMRVIGITLLISGIKNVQVSYVSKNMIFKKFFFATFGGTVGAAVIGIYMAYAGFGVWALIAQSLFNNIVDTIILWIIVPWRPKKLFSVQRLKVLFTFGWKLLMTSLLDSIYGNLRSLIIGKKYSSTDLSYYNRGNGWPSIITTNINVSIVSVLFPAMSKIQDNRNLVKEMTRKSIKVSVYVMAPLLIGLFTLATPLTRLILTEKWLPSLFYLRIFCVTYIFYPIHTANLSAIKAMGRSDYILKLNIIKTVIGLIVLLSTMWISVEAMAWSLLFTSVTSQIINSWPNRKLLNYYYLEQLKDIMPAIFIAIAMGIVIYPIQWLALPDFVTLLISVPTGAYIYIAVSKLLKLDSFEYLWQIVKPVLIKRAHKE